jgi:hypothetical protein
VISCPCQVAHLVGSRLEDRLIVAQRSLRAPADARFEQERDDEKHLKEHDHTGDDDHRPVALPDRTLTEPDRTADGQSRLVNSPALHLLPVEQQVAVRPFNDRQVRRIPAIQNLSHQVRSLLP